MPKSPESVALDPAHRHNARVGFVLFLIYLAAYVIFVGLIAYDYRIMATPVLWGVNLAIVYGMGLIFGAMVLAIVYMALAKTEEVRSQETVVGRNDEDS